MYETRNKISRCDGADQLDRFRTPGGGGGGTWLHNNVNMFKIAEQQTRYDAGMKAAADPEIKGIEKVRGMQYAYYCNEVAKSGWL